MAMHVSDVGELLLKRGRGTTFQPTLEAGGIDHAVLRIVTGDRWSLAPVPAGGLSLLVLDGVATCGTDDLRESMGTGHLMIFDEGERLEIVNDGEGAFIALATRLSLLEEDAL